jgi:hypothetical protein
MSDRDIWNGGDRADDPFEPEVIEGTIAESLRQDAPAMPAVMLVHSLADAYTLPPIADAVLASSRATLARRAEALGDGTLQTGGQRVMSTDSRPAVARFGTHSPQPPRLRVSRFQTAWRTAAAVLVVAPWGTTPSGTPYADARHADNHCPAETCLAVCHAAQWCICCWR